MANGKHSVVSDDPADFARDVLRLFEDASLSERLGGSDCSVVEREYGWESAAQRLGAFHDDVLATNGSH